MFLRAYAEYDHFYVLNDDLLLPSDMKGKTQFISHAERNWLVILNIYEAWRILMKEKPDIILSTGAGPVVAFAIVSRLFFSAKIVFVETITRVKHPSMTGKLMYYLAHDFFYQWESLKNHFPKGKCCGPVI